jgi:tetratricopeptide (TPR) repeat protein
MGKLVPNPGIRMEVDLFESGVRLDTVFTDLDGVFKFRRQSTNTRYEIRIRLGPDAEFQDELEFTSGYPTPIYLGNASRIHYTSRGGQPAASMISVVNLAAPAKAVSEDEKGRELEQQGKHEEALARVQKAVSIYPKYADAYYVMGVIYRRTQRWPEAETAFRKAIDSDGRWTPPYIQLIQVELQKNDAPEMQRVCEQILKLDPALVLGHYFAAVAHYKQGHLDDAEKEGLLAEKNSKEILPQIHLILAQVYEARGDSADAGQRYKDYLKASPQASNAAQVTQKIAQLEKP